MKDHIVATWGLSMFLVGALAALFCAGLLNSEKLNPYLGYPIIIIGILMVLGGSFMIFIRVIKNSRQNQISQSTSN